MEKFTDWHLYIGNKCFVNGIEGVFTGILLTFGDPLIWTTVDEPEPFRMGTKHFHIVLRRLDSMTREENEKYDMWMDFSPDVSGGSFEIIKDMLHFRAYADETRGFINMYYVAQLLNELRKDGFDCDRLIESGQAIDQATLNQKS